MIVDRFGANRGFGQTQAPIVAWNGTIMVSPFITINSKDAACCLAPVVLVPERTELVGIGTVYIA